MAVNVTLREGNGDGTIRRITQANFDDLVAQAALVGITIDSLVPVGGRGITEFRDSCRANFTNFVDGMNVAVASQGVLTVDTQPSVGDTFTVGVTEYTFVAVVDFDTAGEVSIGADLAEAQANIVAAINGTDSVNTANASATISAFDAANEAVLTAITGGVAGNAIVTTETFTAETSVFDDTTMGTEFLGADAVVISGLTSIYSGDSWATLRTKLNANFTILDSSI